VTPNTPLLDVDVDEKYVRRRGSSARLFSTQEVQELPLKKFSGTHRKCIEYLTALVPLIA